MKITQNEISNEACRIQESCELTSLQHFIAGKFWRRIHLVMGVAATIGATVTTALIFTNDETLVSGVFGLCVAILVGLMTFLNPKEHAENHHEKGVDYQQLVANARMLVRIKLPEFGYNEELETHLQGLSDRKFDLDRKSPVAPGGVIYWRAKVAIKKGETKFRVDEKSDSSEESNR